MKKQIKFFFATIAMIIITTMLNSCLWIFGEKYTCVRDIVINNTSSNVYFLTYSSEAEHFFYGASNFDSILLPKIPHTDTLLIAPNEQHIRNQCDYGYYETKKIFERLLIDDYLNRYYKYSDSLYTQNDTIKISYPMIDSVEIVFDNTKHIVIKNKMKSHYFFKELNDFFNTDSRSDESCNCKRGVCKCTFTYFITDEMYEQAEPICR